MGGQSNAFFKSFPTGMRSPGGSGNGSVANIMASAQLGISNHLPFIDGSTPETFIPAVPVVISTPRLFQKAPLAEAMLKALVERAAKEITGIDFGYTMEAQGTIIGKDRQELQMPLQQLITAPSTSFLWQELKGNPVWNLHKFWLDLMMSSGTGASLVAAWFNDEELDPLVVSDFTMDVMFIQYDTTLLPQNILGGVIHTAMWPYETGMWGWQRVNGTSQLQDRTIPYHGIIQDNEKTLDAAVEVARVLAIHRTDYSNATPIATKIADRLTEHGVSDEINYINDQWKAA